MCVQHAYSDDESICHLLARGETTLAELHVALDRQIGRERFGEPRILIDMRETVLNTTRTELEMFLAYLQQDLLPVLDQRDGSVAVLAGFEADIETTTLHETCVELAALAEQNSRLSVVRSFEDACTALDVLAFQI